MKKTIALILSLITFYSKYIAQVNQVTPVSNVKKDQKLIIVTHVEDEKYVAKLSKKKSSEKLNLYKHLVNDYNTYIKESVAKYLNYFSTLEYKTDTEVEAMDKEEKSKYYFLMHTVSDNVSAATGTWVHYSLEKVELDSINTNQYSKVELLNYNKKEKFFEPIVTRNIYYLNFTKADIFYSVQQMNNDLNGSKPDVKTSEILKTKTLILNKEMIESGLSEDDISKIYPHKFKIVDKATFETYRLSGDKKSVCLIIVPFLKTAIPMGMIVKNSIAYAHYIYDPSTGDNYVGFIPSVITGFTDTKEKVSKKSIEAYLKN